MGNAIAIVFAGLVLLFVVLWIVSKSLNSIEQEHWKDAGQGPLHRVQASAQVGKRHLRVEVLKMRGKPTKRLRSNFAEGAGSSSKSASTGPLRLAMWRQAT